HLLDFLSKYGPAAGWAIRQPVKDGPGAEKWTPYYVPKASERCWRYWRTGVIFLALVLSSLLRAWPRVVPLHRQGLEVTTNDEKAGVPPEKAVEITTRCRDQKPEALLALLKRYAPAQGM